MTTVVNEGKFGCAVCNLEFREIKTWESHVSGKKHQYNQHRAEVMRRREESGLFISGFQKASSDSLQSFFRRFGEITEFYHNADKNFVLTTFKEKADADKLLNSSVGIYYSGRRLKINRRRPLASPVTQGAQAASPSTPKPTEPTLPGIDHARVTEVLAHGRTLEELLHELEASPEEKAMYQQVLGDIKTLFELRFPKCNIHPFGSTRTGLNVKGSDIDVFVEILQAEDPSSLDLSAIPQPEKLVRIGQKLMQQNSHYFRSVRAITRAKTPIVKFVHRPTHVSCDVSFKNMLGIANSQLIQHYLRLDPRVYPFFMIVKYWARKHEFSGCGKMSNYALVTIAAFYLQQLDPPVLPTVRQLQELCRIEKQVDGWLCSFSDDPKAVEPSKNTSSLYELLYGFFHFYRNFNINDLVICTLTATTIPKVHFIQPDLLPDVIRQPYMKRPEGKLGLRISTDMCVQDPFELTHNLTASMGGKALKIFLAHCEVGAEIFKEALKQPEDQRLSFLNHLFNRKPKPISADIKGCEYYLSETEMFITYLADETLSIGYLITNPEEERIKELSPTLILERWVSLVYRLVIEFFDKIMKFNVREEPLEQTAAKVQKVDSPSDVHEPPSSIHFSEKRIIHCKGNCRLWEGRRKVQKGLTIPSNLDILKIEEMVSDVMYSACLHKGVPNNPVVSFKCEFQPVKNPPSIKFRFLDAGCEEKNFFNVMMFLRSRLPTVLNKYLKHLKNQIRSQPKNIEVTKEEEKPLACTSTA